MNKKVLVICGSPRKGGNSDTLCNQFIKVCTEVGNIAEKIYLCDKQINFCTACYACKKTGKCVQKDDMTEILDKMGEADVIVLATPVYFYSVDGQIKTMIDRTLPCYYPETLNNKDFYFIATAAEEKPAIERAIDSLYGLTDCINGAKVKGVVYGAGAWQIGDIIGNPAMEDAYRMGKEI
ncbi:MAG: flavodoxin family protein [Lachnospirales bacterium]